MSTRRNFLAGLAITPLMAKEVWAKKKKSESSTFFVGTGTSSGSKGIYAYHFDPATGEPEPIALAAETPSPTFLALSPDGKFVFAANEIGHYNGGKSGSVSSFALDKAAATLRPINTVSSGGAGPCHVATDHTGKVLVAANYAGGSASSFLIGSDGRLSEAVSHFEYESKGPGPGQDPKRQEASHAHRATISPDNRFVLINDLGLDCIHIYELDAATGKLTAHTPPQWTAKPGNGPRALRFHPSGRWAYCVNELVSTVNQLEWDAAAGTLKSLDESSLLPEGYHGVTGAAEIVFNREGSFAYVSNRHNDFLATFKLDTSSGKLSSIRRSPCGGSVPRHIALDPSERWILVANQESNFLSVFRRDRNGELSSNAKSYPIQSPQCVLFV